MIAFVCHPYHRGGVTSWIREAVDAAPAMGLEVRLVTVSPVRPFISGKHRPAMVDFVQSKSSVVAAPAGLFFELGTFEYRVAVYRKLIEKNIPPGWMLIPSDDEACWAACAQLANTYKVIGVLHSDDDYYYNVLHTYKRYLAGATGVSNRIVAKAAMGSLPCTTIPCGIDTTQYSPVEKGPLMVWVGRLEERQKRVSDIVPIAKAIQQSLPHWRIEIYGHGEMDGWLAEQLAMHGITNVYLKGWQDGRTIAAAMGSAKILLQTSAFEGMSVAVIEALASGCVVVSSEVSGVEDLKHEAAFKNLVYLFEVGNVMQAVNKIAEAANNWNTDLQTLAMEVAKERFSIESCMNQYLDFGNGLALPETVMQQEVFWPLLQLKSRVVTAGRWLKYILHQQLSK